MATKKSTQKPAQGEKGWTIESIQELIRMVNKSDLAEVEIEQRDFRLRIARVSSNPGVVYTSAPVMQTAAPAVSSAPAQHQSAEKPAEKAAAPAESSTKTVTFKSPMIGTFYRSAKPDAPPFVKVGDTVSKGQVLCIIEAMKLFNEIESDVNGTIVKVMLDNGNPVEYDQPLFLIEPTA